VAAEAVVDITCLSTTEAYWHAEAVGVAVLGGTASSVDAVDLQPASRAIAPPQKQINRSGRWG